MSIIERKGEKGWKIRLEYTIVSQDIETNKSKIKSVLSVYCPGYSYNTNTGTSSSAYYTIQGSDRVYKSYDWQSGWHTLGERIFTVDHNPDGTKKLTLTGYWNSRNETSYTPQSLSISGTVTLPQIYRKANIISAPDFTDEGNPTVKISNPAGSAVDALDICIAWDDTAQIGYKTVDKTAKSYTFKFTETERDLLRKHSINSKSNSLHFTLRTKIGNYTGYSKAYRTVSIVNADPTFTYSLKDTNSAAIGLTGSNQKLIRGISDVQAIFEPSAKKFATIKSQSISNNGDKVNGTTANFKDVTSGSFTFYVKDSRGNYKELNKNLEIVPYVFPTCNVSATPELTAENKATIHVKVSGNYFDGSFGAKNNTRLLEYRYKGAEWSQWAEIPSTLAAPNTTYTAGFDIAGLDYTQSYQVEVRITDALKSSTGLSKIIRTLPVFDWGENDFNFNVPVKMPEGGLERVRVDLGETYPASKDLTSRSAVFYAYPALRQVWCQINCDNSTQLIKGTNYKILELPANSKYKPILLTPLTAYNKYNCAAYISDNGSVYLRAQEDKPVSSSPGTYKYFISGFWLY